MENKYELSPAVISEQLEEVESKNEKEKVFIVHKELSTGEKIVQEVVVSNSPELKLLRCTTRDEKGVVQDFTDLEHQIPKDLTSLRMKIAEHLGFMLSGDETQNFVEEKLFNNFIQSKGLEHEERDN